MKRFTVVVLDTSGIQKYVFSSNALKHIIGASGLVHEATHDWVYTALLERGPSNVDEKKEIEETACIENGELESELVYAGGGNTVILFKNPDQARIFIRSLTRRVLQDAPGLEIVAAMEEFDWDDSDRPLVSVVQQVVEQANQRKIDRLYSQPLPGLGVTASCQYTGLPAVHLVDDERVSSEIWEKLHAVDRSNARLNEIIPEEYRNYYEFVSDFSDIGDRHESSYIAVVHIDGNSMGKRVRALAELPKNQDNRTYIRSIREFSKSIEEAARHSLKESVLTILQSMRDGKIGGVVSINNHKLPFRPIIFGGDDITFVCDGRLGLTLTAHYLQLLTNQTLSTGEKISARAGVAVVKSHYPFARAYQIAEDLAASAKAYIAELDENDIKQTSALDWHFSSSGPVLELKDLRKREYEVPAGSLVMRPVHIENGGAWRSWKQFTSIVGELKDPEKWTKGRNKLKTLREILRNGPKDVQHFRRLYRLPLFPTVLGEEEASQNTGWIGKNCTLFDAIEALDFFVPLEGSDHA